MLYTGYKLCAPKVWKHVAHIGSEQLFVFTTTVLVTITTDLLWGIAAGILAKLVLEASILTRVVRGRPEGPSRPCRVAGRWLGQTGELFRNPVVQSGTVGDALPPVLRAAAGLLQLDAARRRRWRRSPAAASSVYLHITDLVTLDRPHHGQHAPEFRRGLQAQRPRHRPDRRTRPAAKAVFATSPAFASARRSWRRNGPRPCRSWPGSAWPRRPRMSPTRSHYLERISLTHLGPAADPDDHVITEAVSRACRSCRTAG